MLFTGEVSPTMLDGVADFRNHRSLRAATRLRRARRACGPQGQVGVSTTDLPLCFCVGEQLAERESGRTEEVVGRQVGFVVDQISPRRGRPHDHRLRAGVGHRHRRQRHARPGRGRLRLHSRSDRRLVRPRGRRARPSPLRRQRQHRKLGTRSPGGKNVDGALVGGASLDAPDFVRLVEITRDALASRLEPPGGPRRLEPFCSTVHSRPHQPSFPLSLSLRGPNCHSERSRGI